MRRALAVATLASLIGAGYAVSAVGSSDKASRAKQGARSVTVDMTGRPPNFRFTGVPREIRAGNVRFTFRNRSTQPSGVRHNFVVVRTFGQARAFRSRTLASNQSQTRTINLRRGWYVAVCTIGNGFHAANRMTTAFVVE